MRIDMEAVVAELKQRGHPAYIEQTGGGTATIYAGPTHEEPGWGTRYAAAAGPGWFEGPGWTKGTADSDDFWIGTDTDDPRLEDEVVPTGFTSAQVADAIELAINRNQAGGV